MPESATVLVADVGGTHMRFALARAGIGGAIELSAETTLPTAAGRFGEALAGYLQRRGRPQIAACGVCAAGPLATQGGRASIRLTNSELSITAAGLREASGVRDCRLFNDFSAIALSLPALQEGHLRHLGGPAQGMAAARAVIGPGTGLGVSGLLSAGGAEAVIEGEGGHVDLAAVTPLEADVLRAMRPQGDPVSAEQALSGPGLERLYKAAAQVRRTTVVQRTASEISRRAFDGTDAVAAEAVTLFTGWLGRVAGDLALTLGARGGVYLAGGILPAWGEHFDARRFRQGFEDKGDFRPYLERIPAWLITHPHPGLLGLARTLIQAPR